MPAFRALCSPRIYEALTPTRMGPIVADAPSARPERGERDGSSHWARHRVPANSPSPTVTRCPLHIRLWGELVLDFRDSLDTLWGRLEA